MKSKSFVRSTDICLLMVRVDDMPTKNTFFFSFRFHFVQFCYWLSTACARSRSCSTVPKINTPILFRLVQFGIVGRLYHLNISIGWHWTETKSTIYHIWLMSDRNDASAKHVPSIAKIKP